MALPLIPILTAIAVGGSLVPHAAGGMIVTSAAGYVAGTYLSTSAITGILAVTTATVGTGLAATVGALKGMVGRAAIGTAITATTTETVATAAGLTTPAWIPIAVGGTALVLGYGTYRLLKLKKKVAKIPKGKEAQFTDTEAKIVEQLLRFMPNGGS